MLNTGFCLDEQESGDMGEQESEEWEVIFHRHRSLEKLALEGSFLVPSLLTGCW